MTTPDPLAETCTICDQPVDDGDEPGQDANRPWISLCSTACTTKWFASLCEADYCDNDATPCACGASHCTTHPHKEG